MISTALVGPVYVGLAEKGSGTSLGALGGLVLASGLANLDEFVALGRASPTAPAARRWPQAARSAAFSVSSSWSLHLVPGLGGSTAFFAVAVFVLYVGHSGVRIGRKTQVVDLAGPDSRSEYVALANTVIGILLLILRGGRAAR